MEIWGRFVFICSIQLRNLRWVPYEACENMTCLPI